MKSLKLTPLEKSWVLYDVANSAFTMLVSTILPILSSSMAAAEGYTTNQATSAWSYVASFSTLIFVILGPILGSFADIRDQKKKFFLFFLLLGVAGCVALGFAPTWMLFLVIFCIAKIGYNGSLVFYDSMLTDVTEDNRMDTVSSLGYAFGYIGSCIPFIAGVAFVLLCEDNLGILPLTLGQAGMIALLICGVWWVTLTMPLLKRYRQVYYVERPPHVVADTFRHLGSTLRNISKNKPAFMFLLAFFFYIDGVYTIIEIATPYGQSMGIGTVDLLLALLLTQIVAFPCAILFGRLAARFRTRPLLLSCIGFYFGIAVFAFFLRQAWQFWVLAILVGMVQGGIQALSRSYFARLIPKEHSNEFFGFYDIFGKSASVLGTFLMGLIIDATNKPNLGVIPIAIMFIIGFVLLTQVPKTAADE